MSKANDKWAEAERRRSVALRGWHEVVRGLPDGGSAVVIEHQACKEDVVIASIPAAAFTEAAAAHVCRKGVGQ